MAFAGGLLGTPDAQIGAQSHSLTVLSETHTMVIDTLQNAKLYSGLGSRIATALKFLQEQDGTQLPLGKTPIDGDRIFALVQDNTTKPRAEGVWEAHRHYIDVQFVAAGIEQMGWAPVADLTVKKPYDADADYALFEGPGNFVTVPAGSFTIFFPSDGHTPGVAFNDQPSAVRKIVIKVAV